MWLSHTVTLEEAIEAMDEHLELASCSTLDRDKRLLYNRQEEKFYVVEDEDNITIMNTEYNQIQDAIKVYNEIT